MACVATAPALAASESVTVNVPKTVKEGQTFTVTAQGTAAQNRPLAVVLTHQPCAQTYQQSHATYKKGDSYFLISHGPGTPAKYKSASTTTFVNGPFKKKFTGHAGTVARKEYACAYLVTPLGSAQPHSFASYTVTK